MARGGGTAARPRGAGVDRGARGHPGRVRRGPRPGLPGSRGGSRGTCAARNPLGGGERTPPSTRRRRPCGITTRRPTDRPRRARGSLDPTRARARDRDHRGRDPSHALRRTTPGARRGDRRRLGKRRAPGPSPPGVPCIRAEGVRDRDPAPGTVRHHAAGRCVPSAGILPPNLSRRGRTHARPGPVRLGVEVLRGPGRPPRGRGVGGPCPERIRRGCAKATARDAFALFLVGDAGRARRVRSALRSLGLGTDRAQVWTLGPAVGPRSRG